MILVDEKNSHIEVDGALDTVCAEICTLLTLIDTEQPKARIMPMLLSAFYMNKTAKDDGEVMCKEAIEAFKDDTLLALEFIQETNDTEGNTIDQKLESHRKEEENE